MLHNCISCQILKVPDIEVLQRRYRRFCNWYIVPDIEYFRYRRHLHDIEEYFKPFNIEDIISILKVEIQLQYWIGKLQYRTRSKLLDMEGITSISRPLSVGYRRHKAHHDGGWHIQGTPAPSEDFFCSLQCYFRSSRWPSRAAPTAFIQFSTICCGVTTHSPCASPRAVASPCRPRSSRNGSPRTGWCWRRLAVKGPCTSLSHEL